MIVEHYKSINRLWRDLCFWWLDKKPGLEFSQKYSGHSRRNLLTAETLSDLELNLGDVGFTKNRWNQFLSQYVPSESVLKKEINDMITLKNRSTRDDIYFPFKDTDKHTGGNCIIGFSFYSRPNPTFTLYSRHAIIPSTCSLELAFCSLMAEHLENQGVRKVEFNWFCNTFQWPLLQMLPYIEAQGLTAKYRDVPAFNHLYRRLFQSE